MKYKLLKPLPWAEAGTEYNISLNGRMEIVMTKCDESASHRQITIPNAEFSKWFAPIEEDTRWKPGEVGMGSADLPLDTPLILRKTEAGRIGYELIEDSNAFFQKGDATMEELEELTKPIDNSWKPEGEIYYLGSSYFCSQFLVRKAYWTGTDEEIVTYEAGLIFRTKADATLARDRIAELLQTMRTNGEIE